MQMLRWLALHPVQSLARLALLLAAVVWPTHVQGACNLVALGGVLQATVHVPEASTQGAHAKGATYVVQDSVWTRLPAMLHCLLGLLLHACCCCLRWVESQPVNHSNGTEL